MALNPSTNVTMAGRITAADANYPFGSSRDESAPGAGDGSPYFKARADDIFGLQQALLRAAGITPSGSADTALLSEYLQAIIEQVMGRANTYDDTGVANAYVLAIRTNQQRPSALFDDMVINVPIANTNTGASTVDVSLLLGQSAGTTVLAIVDEAGGALSAGALTAGTMYQLRYDLANTRFERVARGEGGPSLGTDSVIRTNAQNIAENITFAGTENGMSAGPITIDTGFTVTVTTGSNWVVV